MVLKHKPHTTQKTLIQVNENSILIVYLKWKIDEDCKTTTTKKTKLYLESTLIFRYNFDTVLCIRLR